MRCFDSQKTFSMSLERRLTICGIAPLFTLLLFFSFLATPSWAKPAESFNVLADWNNPPKPKTTLQKHLNETAFKLLKKRGAHVETLRTTAQWKHQQTIVKAQLDKVFGPFPQKTPLNAQVLETIQKDGYRIEKIIFESLPQFYIPASLFVPNKRQEKAPAILNFIGHFKDGFRAPENQNFILNLVKKGFIVLTIDSLSQGERYQYYDPTLGKSVVGVSTAEHSYFGAQVFLTGNSSASYFLWDAIRALDYLTSRKEVDSTRIGVSGFSGGGMLASYLSAMDDRVAATAICSYIVGFHDLLKFKGPQDAEQNLNRALLNYLDHADLLEVLAPRPTLVVATKQDSLKVEGTRKVVVEAKKAFEAFGAASNLRLIEDEGGHELTNTNSEAIYSFFQKELQLPGSPKEQLTDLLTDKELAITSTGQVATALGGETVFSLNLKNANPLLTKLDQNRKDLSRHLSSVVADAKSISGYRPPIGPIKSLEQGTYPRNGYSIEKHIIKGEGDLYLPFLLAIPDTPGPHSAIIYLHPQGKAAEINIGGDIEGFVKNGFAVLSIDLSGTGELGNARQSDAFLGLLIGRSIVAIRAADIVRATNYLQTRNDIDQSGFAAIGYGSMGIPLLHAAAFEDSIKQVAIVDSLISFRSILSHKIYNLPITDFVFNSLTKYDLPDLAASLAPRRLLMLNVKDHLGDMANKEMVDAELQIVKRAYHGEKSHLLIRNQLETTAKKSLLQEWFK